MTVYEKLAEARVRFQETAPKMSGKNTFAGYSYFELSDILPVINRLGKEMGFVCIVSFSSDSAWLNFVDTEKKDDVITFGSPMSSASLKGCHDVQNLGAVETYIKRYLYQNAFEIVEADAVNGTHNPNVKPPAPVTIQTVNPETEKLVRDLTDWMAFDPPVFNAMQIMWAEKQISEKNIEGIRTAIAKAVDLSKAAIAGRV
jgi:hypothetical protein